MKYQSYLLHNYKNIPQIKNLSEEQINAIDVVGSVLPFKTNNYVVENLINWEDPLNDPMFILTFPQKDMLLPEYYSQMEPLVLGGASKAEIREAANTIRLKLNPHPDGQLENNVPFIDGEKMFGTQHKYQQTVLFFPSQGQTCHAYCTFCFRWPQFVGMDELKFASKEAELLVKYVKSNSEITDVLFTGGDALIMKTKHLETYIRPLLEANIEHLKNIRLGTKALSYWPYRFTTDNDAKDLLNLFEDVQKCGKKLSFQAHFNHPVELGGKVVEEAVRRIIETGAVIRSQAPLVKHINDSAEVWAEMWKKQVSLGITPYYMFVERNTGAYSYFSVPLVEAWQIFRNAYELVSGICRTARGPIMSCLPGKIQIIGITEVGNEKVIVMTMLQGRNPDWVLKPFFAKYDEKAIWYNELKPALGKEKFYFDDELNDILKKSHFSSIPFEISNSNDEALVDALEHKDIMVKAV